MARISSSAKHLFVRDAGAALTALSQRSLTPKSAAEFEGVFRLIEADAKTIDARGYARIAGLCAEVCQSLIRPGGSACVGQASDLIQDGCRIMHEDLFRVALGATLGEPQGIRDLAGRLERFVQPGRPEAAPSAADVEGARATPVANPGAERHGPEVRAESAESPRDDTEPSDAEWRRLTDITTGSIAAIGSPIAGMQAAAGGAPIGAGRRLLQSLARVLSSQGARRGEIREELLRTARAAAEVEGVAFWQICRELSSRFGEEVHTITPGVVVERDAARAFRSCLERSLPGRLPGELSEASLSVRKLAGQIIFELRWEPGAWSTPVGEISENELAAGGMSVSVESRALSDSSYVCRVAAKAQLPVFEAYRLRCSSGEFLVPAEERLSVAITPEIRAGAVGLEAITGARSSGAAQGQAAAPRDCMVVLFRGRETAIGVSSIHGPETFIGEPVSARARAGIAGWAAGADGRRLPVLDLEPLLDRYFSEPLGAAGKRAESREGMTEFIVFHAAGLRLAVARSWVVGAGKVTSPSALEVVTRKGVLRLADPGELSGAPGAGDLYLAVRSKAGTLAWRVDRLAKVPLEYEFSVEGDPASAGTEERLPGVALAGTLVPVGPNRDSDEAIAVIDAESLNLALLARTRNRGEPAA